ncbi:hypothetical protein LKO27_01225 [Tessaracoccus sp. OS52]|uniref:hypothetical protein n=1 Tax=Tessaracoccus sp. OS52 TaxID=2886691 RepID=UPI001D111D00|nr:hypothetical protein [Tessaracoccus sp. OS52]MCC2592052.1 hypothetical protein [Tessaracoccus sp. OS52]
MAFHRWLPTAEPATPDPLSIAQRLLAELDLEAIELGVYPHTTDHMPGSMSVVGWNMWLWADAPSESTWGPVTTSDTVSGHTVTLTAEVAEVVWDMGNGDTVTCGLGTKWNPAYIRSEPSPDCGYVYSKDGDYQVTATTNWTVAWQGIGESGTIPLQLSRTEHLQVAEVQVVVTSGG